jgi:hypothetical protein
LRIQAGTHKRVLPEIDSAAVPEVAGQSDSETRLQESPGNVLLDSPLPLFDAANPDNLGWFSQRNKRPCQTTLATAGK